MERRYFSNSKFINSKFKIVLAMEKKYIIPAIEVSLAEVEQIIAASITGIGGDSGLGMNTGETPDEGNVKESDFFGDDSFDN